MSATLTRLRRPLAAATLALFVFGCGDSLNHMLGREHSHDDDRGDRGDEEEGKTAVITVWADRFEAFIEHDYLVVDRPTKFITHISDLKTLEPRREGPITFVMKHGDAPALRQEVPEVARDGIYLPMIAFPKTGTWAVRIEVPLGDETYQIALPNVTVYADDAAVKAAPEPEEIDGITYLKEQQWKLGTGADPAGKRTLIERLRVSARVAAPLSARAEVFSPVAGELLPPDGGSIPGVGEKVQAGQILARVRPPLTTAELLQLAGNRLSARSTELQARTARTQIETLLADLDVRLAESEAKIQEAEARRDHSQQILTRVAMLYEQKAKSQKQLERARFDVKKAEAEVAVARALVHRFRAVREQLKRIIDRGDAPAPDLSSGLEAPVFELKAPISGIVTRRDGVCGERVDPSRALASILDPSKVLIKARVPETDLPRLAESRAASYQVPGTEDAWHAILEQGGRFLHLGYEVDERTRTAPMVYAVPNPDGALRIGMALTVFLETRRAVEALCVPESAIVDEDGRPIAFVHVSGETYEKRDLSLGLRAGGWVQVTAGLAEGERVVTKGAFNIRVASLSTKLPAHGHAH